MGEEVKPIPKRWWWTKRLGIPLAVCLIALIGIRIGWGSHAEITLKRELDAIAARGEPIRWADLAGEPVPDEENAAELYKAALEAHPFLKPPPERETDEFPFWAPRTRQRDPRQARLDRLNSMLDCLVSDAGFRLEHAKEVGEILELSREAFALCRRARTLERSDWKTDFTVPAIRAPLPPFYQHRQLVKLLCLAALSAHEAGDDPAAVEYVRDALAHARSLSTVPNLISCLVRMIMDQITCATIERIAPNLRVGAAPPAARPDQLRAVINDLLEEKDVRDGLVWAFMGERSRGYDTCERIRSFRWSEFDVGELRQPPLTARLWLHLVCAPVWKLDEARVIRRATACVEAAREMTYPAMVEKWPSASHEERRSKFELWARMLSLLLSAPFGQIADIHFRAVASWRMAATALAMRLHQIDHAGRRPETLADLVGDYLPAVPEDPFADDGRRLAYLPQADSPLLYSVGTNGTDEGGAFVLNDRGFVDADGSGDWVFFLNGDRPEGRCEWTEPPEQAPSPARRPSARASGSRPAPAPPRRQ